MIESFLIEISSNPLIARIDKNLFSTKLLDWNDIENYLNDYLHHSKIEIIDSNGLKIPLFKKEIQWGTTYDMDVIYNHITNGRTFVLVSMNRFNKSINQLCELIETYTNSNADVHIYSGLSNQSNSFSIHCDRLNNVIIQLDGKSDWKVWDQHKPNNDSIPLIDQVLNPGDCLYIPKYCYHQCIPLGKRISISIPYGKSVKTNRKWYNF